METQLGSTVGGENANGGAAPGARAHAQKGAPASRKRAATELLARHSSTLKQTARRYSLCREDAEDAYQRAMEIVLTKAPTEESHELIRWTQTVVKHEALAIRSHRERMLGGFPATEEGQADDWIALIPASGDGPDVRVERRERIARMREALRTLKPAELRALTLLAQGYSYTEIGRITRFSYTKVNRCIAEGRERFREMLARSEDGSRCREMGPKLSAFCDGETSAEEAAAVREHLRACASCRAALRTYRAAPRAVAALAPALPIWHSLLEGARHHLSGMASRLSGRGGHAGTGAGQATTAGGGYGVGLAGVVKVAAVCAAAVGGASAYAISGPPQLDLTPQQVAAPSIEPAAGFANPAEAQHSTASRRPKRRRHKPEAAPAPPTEAVAEPAAAELEPPVEAEAVEIPTPPAEPPPPPVSEPPPPPPATASPDSAAGEFGP